MNALVPSTAPLEVRAGALTTALNWLYDRVAPNPGAAPGIGTEADIDRWIAQAVASAGTAGFVANIGGLLTLPIALPANLVGVAAIQVRLVAQIAGARGYDVHSAEVRSLVLACLLGTSAFEVLKEAGIALGQTMGQRAIQAIAGATLARINKAVGFQLITKAGSQGIVNLTKVVPFIGGVIGGSVDALGTRAVGAVAKRMFPRVDATPTAAA